MDIHTFYLMIFGENEDFLFFFKESMKKIIHMGLLII